MPEKKSATQKATEKRETALTSAVNSVVAETRQVDYCRVVKGVVVCGY